ncbi:MAG: DUF2599 domain-containing protein [Candidatus Fimenecus sp.]
MKHLKFLAKFLVFTLFLTSFSSLPVFAKVSQKQNPYYPYKSFNELYIAYNEAVQKKDSELQNKLLQIAKASLEYEMNEEANVITPSPKRIDPDKAYWINKFWEMFNYGRWDMRPTGITLSLGPKNHGIWTSKQKSNGWNAISAKFCESHYWNNTECMKQQFYCHARLGYAAVEQEWNLEPWKTTINPITCN